MTPARRSGGVLASALLRSEKRFVPEAVSPLGRDEVTQRTCRLAMPASLPSSSRRIAAVCSGRPPIDWLKLSSTTTMAMLARLSRSSWRSVGLESASSSAASDNARRSAPRLLRTSSTATRRAASTAPDQNSTDGTIGEKSIDQLLTALSPQVHRLARARNRNMLACRRTCPVAPRAAVRRRRRASSRRRHKRMAAREGAGTLAPNRGSKRASLPKPLQEGRHMHLIGLVVAGEGVHDDVDAGAQRHLALALAARDGRIEILAPFIAGPRGAEVVGRNQDRTYAIDTTRLPALVAVSWSLRLHPQLSAIPAAREGAQQVERLGQHVMLWHGLQARDVQIAEQTLQRRATLAAEGEARRHALAIILGVENDHATLFHVGVDLGQCCLRQRPCAGQHRPVEDGKKSDLIVEDVDRERLARLHGRALDQEPAKPDQALTAHLVRRAVARKD